LHKQTPAECDRSAKKIYGRGNAQSSSLARLRQSDYRRCVLIKKGIGKSRNQFDPE